MMACNADWCQVVGDCEKAEIDNGKEKGKGKGIGKAKANKVCAFSFSLSCRTRHKRALSLTLVNSRSTSSVLRSTSTGFRSVASSTSTSRRTTTLPAMGRQRYVLLPSIPMVSARLYADDHAQLGKFDTQAEPADTDINDGRSPSVSSSASWLSKVSSLVLTPAETVISELTTPSTGTANINRPSTLRPRS